MDASATGSGRAVWYLAATPATVSQWLVRLIRTGVAMDGLVLVAAVMLPAGEFPLRRLAPLVAGLAFVGIERSSSRSRGERITRFTLAAHLMLLVALLTGLLELSGGPSNAFSVIYVVLIALAAVTLGGGWAAAVAVASVAAYGLLISWHLEELVPAHHRLIDFPTHLFTMWIAISTMAEMAAHFIGAASRAVAQRERGIPMQSGAPTFAVPSLARVEWEHIQRVLADCGGNLSQAARLLGIHRRSLQRKLWKDPVPENQ